MITKIYRPKDVLIFGKHKGFTLAEIYKYEPSYIEWLIMHDPDFKISIYVFENLPNCTPISYVPGAVSNREAIMNNKSLSLLKKYELTNSFNQNKGMSIKDIKRMIDEGEPTMNFKHKFDAKLVQINNSKI